MFNKLMVISLVTVGLVACSNQAHAEGTKIIATTTQVCDFVKEIAGNEVPVDLTCLIAPNASAHEFEPTSEQMTQLSRADMFIENGLGLEEYMDNVIDSSGFKGTRVISAGVDKDGNRVADVQDAVTPELWPFRDSDPDEDFLYDPHVWMSVNNAIIQVKNIGAAMAKVDSAHADAINKRTAAVVSSYQALDQWIRDSFATVPEPNRVLFTSHDAFGYFCNAYGIRYIGTALSDFSNQNDATAAHIAQAAQAVRDSGAVAIFGENSNSAKSIEAIAQAAGVTAYTDDDALYGDSLGPNQTYAESMVHNVNLLVSAWKGTDQPVPAQATTINAQ